MKPRKAAGSASGIVHTHHAAGPINSEQKFSLQREISSIAGDGYSGYFCSTLQLSQQRTLLPIDFLYECAVLG
jgi:hypothetical protein